MSGADFLKIIGIVLPIGTGLWTWWSERNLARRHEKAVDRQEKAVVHLKELWSDSQKLNERHKEEVDRQEQAVRNFEDVNKEFKKTVARFEEIEADRTVLRRRRRKMMIVFAGVVAISMTAWAIAVGGTSEEEGSMTEAVTFLLALVGLLLTARGFVVAKQTGRDVRDIKDKLDAVLARLGRLRREMGRLAMAFGAATLLVVVLLWLSHCNRATVTPTGGADQIGYVGQPLPVPVEVLVQTNSGIAEGATVVFAPMRGHGTANPDAALADSAGRAQTVWTLGSKAGEQRMAARVLGGNSVWITAEASARDEPVATDIKITPDSALLAFAGDIVPFSAEITDQYGDPFPGSVTWSSKQQCIFRAGRYGFAIARATGVDSIVAVFDTLRATAPVRVEIDGR